MELKPFTRRWKQLDLTDKDLQALQILLMIRPRAGDVIEGTGGLRKVRFSPLASPDGKSGSLRICCVYVEEVATIVLASVYSKVEQDDLGADDKSKLRAGIDRVRDLLLSRPYRCQQQSEVEE